ncbi:MAG: hypothetical protein HY648_11885, partial [Acidobacteria bacterium]|nr:hypothetical protein [Acidobacteriota bacterium]
MQVHWSFHHVPRNPRIDKAIQSSTRKMEKLLERFSPDLVHLHGLLEYNAAHQGPVCSLNLWLPTGQLHSREESGTELAALKACFDQLIEQVKKHKQVLRRESVWKRRRYKVQQEIREIQAGEIRITDRQRLRDYLDQVLPQLARFVARELRWRETAGLLPPGQAGQEEVVNEVVVRVLDNFQKKVFDTELPFHHLLREAIQVLNGSSEAASMKFPATAEKTPGSEIASELLAGRIGASHLWQRQPLPESSPAEALPPDPVDIVLANLPVLERQVYVLRALEGFEQAETANVLGKPEPEIEMIFQRVSREIGAALDR